MTLRAQAFGLCALLLACGSDPAGSPPGGGDAATPVTCDSVNWRNPSPGIVSCPGVSSCTCGGSAVCCVGRSGDEVTGSSCQTLTSCAGVAFECDGPEDCSGGTVCCASIPDAGGGGSSCVPEGECFGIDTYTLCRGDDDCTGLDDCIPATADSYFRQTVGYCD